MRIESYWQLMRDAVANRVAAPCELTYINDRANWAVTSVAHDLVDTLNASRLVSARTSTTHYGTRRTILHFGSPYTYLYRQGVHSVHASNTIIVSVFHIAPANERIRQLVPNQGKLRAIHVPTTITQQALMSYGISPEKIVYIPFGVNLDVYKPADQASKQSLRRKMGIPVNAFVVGSFQKDGHGWGRGLEPKLVKGPDLLVESLLQLRTKAPVFALLAGPSRGYVRTALTKHNIPHVYLGYQADRQAVARAYHALDAYVISSRVEGGPLQLLEAWASGVPVVSTRVGMSADLGRDRENILLTDTSGEHIAKALVALHSHQELSQYLVKNALALATRHSWDVIARRYYEFLYKI